MMVVVAVVILTGSFIRCTIAAPLTSILRTSWSTKSSTSATQSAVKYDEVDGGGKSVKKLSKGRKIIKKSEKLQRPEKLQRLSVWRNVYWGIDPPSKNSNVGQTLTVFRALFARPRSSLDTTFRVITDEAKLIELLVLFWLLTRQD